MSQSKCHVRVPHGPDEAQLHSWAQLHSCAQLHALALQP